MSESRDRGVEESDRDREPLDGGDSPTFLSQRPGAPYRRPGEAYDTTSARRVVDRWVGEELRSRQSFRGVVGSQEPTALECVQRVLDEVGWERTSQRYLEGSPEEWESWLLLDAARTRLREEFGRSTSEARRAWMVRIWERRREDERIVQELTRVVAEHSPDMEREAVLGYVAILLDDRAQENPPGYEGAWALAEQCHREAVLSRQGRQSPVERGGEDFRERLYREARVEIEP